MKRTIRLKESELRRMISESVRRVLNEVGDTKRGQYMLGRLKNRQSNGGGKFSRGINYNDAGDYAHKANGNSYSDDYQQGYEDEGNNGRNADSTWDGDKYRRMQFNYDAKLLDIMSERISSGFFGEKAGKDLIFSGFFAATARAILGSSVSDVLIVESVRRGGAKRLPPQ